MRTLFTLAALALSLAGANAANFPFIRLNGKTNIVSDNGTNLTYNGTAVGSSPWTNSPTGTASLVSGVTNFNVGGRVYTMDTNNFGNGSGTLVIQGSITQYTGLKVLGPLIDDVTVGDWGIPYTGDLTLASSPAAYASQRAYAAATLSGEVMGFFAADWFTGASNVVGGSFPGYTSFKANPYSDNATNLPTLIGFHADLSNAAATNAYGILIENVTTGTEQNYAIKTGLGKVEFGEAISAGFTNKWKFSAKKSCTGLTMVVTNYLEVVIDGVTNAIPLGTITP